MLKPTINAGKGFFITVAAKKAPVPMMHVKKNKINVFIFCNFMRLQGTWFYGFGLDLF
jgi:hypothetical protein